MEQQSDNKHHRQSMPKYILAIFIIIIAIIGFGIGQKIYKNNLFPTNSTIVSPNLSGEPIDVKPVPTIKENSPDPNIKASNIILLDADSKYMLYGNGAHEKVPIASITKLMTALIVADMGKNDIVTIESQDINVIGSKIGLEVGEKIKTQELLKGLLIQSGNDTAITLARSTAGSLPAFVDLMNKKASDLGLHDTHYVDPHGLSPDGYSSPFDQAIILSYALNTATIYDIIKTNETTIKAETGQVHELKNSNRLVTDELHYDGVIGGKTGFTVEAGHSLATAAKRDDHTLISVILHTDSNALDASARETAKLLDWGFSNFEWR